jgi:hypothetical protein
MIKLGRLKLYYDISVCYQKDYIFFDFFAFGVDIDREQKFVNIKLLVLGINLILEVNVGKSSKTKQAS